MADIEWMVFVGAAGFTIALIPQVVRTIRLGRAQDVSAAFSLLIIGASALTLTYWVLRDEPWYIWGGFAANMAAWSVVLWYRLRPRPGSVAAPAAEKGS